MDVNGIRELVVGALPLHDPNKPDVNFRAICAEYLSDNDLQTATWKPSLSRNAAFPEEFYSTFQVCQYTGRSFRDIAVERLTGHPHQVYYALVIEGPAHYTTYDAYT